MFYLGATQLQFDSWFATGKESKDTMTNCWAGLLSKLSCAHISVTEVKDVTPDHGVSAL